ncbi:hypothetical protein CHLNCDRAFT_140842 [Chlorella variabilis]|uniref:Uncharacterized protein n=1 Tax=Chlorella variabilis TaxID=554065 RepID=E1Z6B9_CHLVA|nr:hypothetical protein CHLNCDRAFT_140842 [Chlorella variabilis]EFN58622.1 hypothetical protein CHLNCDRAFT_140842 [Chlorella variabilis]|eukprot:XP_005850724.1 hypothetical protein CHLNCDRAFT_140842 [Chlorella variabilis]
MIDDTLVDHELFGGAVGCSFPQRFIDISQFRPVPDHQEVFSDASLDQSLVIEIVVDEQRVLTPQDMPRLPPDCFKALVVGQQAVAKGQQGSSALNKVQIILCCVRLPQHGSDLLITLNSPIFISEKSAAAQHAGAGFKGAHLLAPLLFKQIIASFRINNWGLFGGRPAPQ